MSNLNKPKQATPLANALRDAHGRQLGPQTRTTGWREAAAQTNAGASGAADMIAFGKAKELNAAKIAADALGGPGMALFKPKEFRELYAIAYDLLKQQEAYDAQNRKTARRVGQVGGAVVGILGAPEIAAAKAIYSGARGVRALAGASRGTAPILAGPGRLATQPASRIIDRVTGTTAIAAGGGLAGGLAGEGVSQAIKGDFSARGLAAGAAGGLVDGITTKFAGSSLGGAAGGLTDSVARGNYSLEEVLQSMSNGAILGRAGRAWGKDAVEQLSSYDKGQLGEQLSILKSFANGQAPVDVNGDRVLRPITDVHKRHVKTGVGDAIPDLEVGPLNYAEAKMGPWADTTPAQDAVLREGNVSMRVDHWMPIHVGNSLGAGLSSTGVPLLQFEDPAKVGPDPSSWSIFNSWAR